MPKRRTKEINLQMKFNPGLQKYEPKLPLRKAKKRDKTALNLKEILAIVVILLFVLSPFIFWYFLLK